MTNTKKTQGNGTIRLTNPAIMRAFMGMPRDGAFYNTYPIKEAKRWTNLDSVSLTPHDIREGMALLRLRYLTTVNQEEIKTPANNLISMRSKLEDSHHASGKEEKRASLIFDVTPEEFADVLEKAKLALDQQNHHTGQVNWPILVEKTMAALAQSSPETAADVMERLKARQLCDPRDSDRQQEKLRFLSDSGKWSDLLGPGTPPLGRG